MRHVEILGFECAACRKTQALIEEIARDLKLTVHLERVDDPARTAAYRIHAVPAIVVDGVLVYSGGIPTRWQIELWLTIPLARKLTA
jgi:hypothetical protein